MKRFLFATALALVAVGSGLPASAAPVINNTGISAPTETITFSEFTFASGTSITNQFASLGVTFSSPLFYDVQPVFFPTDFLANFDLSDHANNPDSIMFAHDQTAAAFAMQTNLGTSTFTALLNGTPVESFNASTDLSFLPDLSNASNFYGFSGILFNQIEITSGTTCRPYLLWWFNQTGLGRDPPSWRHSARRCPDHGEGCG
jgi:hypothetical protein